MRTTTKKNTERTPNAWIVLHAEIRKQPAKPFDRGPTILVDEGRMSDLRSIISRTPFDDGNPKVFTSTANAALVKAKSPYRIADEYGSKYNKDTGKWDETKGYWSALICMPDKLKPSKAGSAIITNHVPDGLDGKQHYQRIASLLVLSFG